MVERQGDSQSNIPDVDNSNLYKQFGRENDVGKLLYGMYASKKKPEIYYPPVKTKQFVDEPKEMKPCPAKTVIEYPEPQRRQYRKYNPIDFVPKRKAGEQILNEIDIEKSRPLGKGPGVPQDRAARIADLQDRFQFKNNDELERALRAKRAANEAATTVYELDDKTRRQQKFKGGISKNALSHYEQKYGVQGSEVTRQLQKASDAKHVASAQDAELEDLFDSITEEIEERQEHLVALGDSADKATQERIKNEICERVGELQRIRALQSKGI